MATISQLLKTKGSELFSITPDRPVLEALKIMAAKKIGALLVMQDKMIVGIFTERDYARKVILEGKHSDKCAVEDVMTERVIYVRPDQTIEESMALMTDKHVRHLPVCEGETIYGIISIGDVVKAMISEKEFIISQLEHYITGRR
jgi:CBS domain-containing protein